MTVHAPRLPVSLDPLVAEAKRRARRRRVSAGDARDRSRSRRSDVWSAHLPRAWRRGRRWPRATLGELAWDSLAYSRRFQRRRALWDACLYRRVAGCVPIQPPLRSKTWRWRCVGPTRVYVPFPRRAAVPCWRGANHAVLRTTARSRNCPALQRSRRGHDRNRAAVHADPRARNRVLLSPHSTPRTPDGDHRSQRIRSHHHRLEARPLSPTQRSTTRPVFGNDP